MSTDRLGGPVDFTETSLLLALMVLDLTSSLASWTFVRVKVVSLPPTSESVCIVTFFFWAAENNIGDASGVYSKILRIGLLCGIFQLTTSRLPCASTRYRRTHDHL